MANVIAICGSLRKGSFNRMLMQALPGLAPAGMSITEAPSFADFPVYNADQHNAQGIPASVTALSDAELLDVERHVESEPLAIRPVEIAPLLDRRIVIAMVGR